jgi:Raf kinase inhibitor-like YbhB/YbcL family protein
MKAIWVALAIFLGGILNMNAASSISITSPAFQAGGDIPAKFTCNGTNVSPELQISGVPSEAKSLVLIVDDPDAPRGLFTHWIAWSIDPKTTRVAENSAPAGVQGTNDFGKRNYGGPCPPSGTHRYFFKTFALDTKLELKASARRAELDAAMRGHVLGQGELMARYSHW